ncbi:MAG: asparagine synthase-related protein [Acidimicrobiales bacterium]
MLNFRVIGELDPCLAWDGSTLRQTLPDPTNGSATGAIEGAFAGLVQAPDGDAVTLARDPLGLDKLFWAATGDQVDLASRPSLLTAQGHALDACYAVPANSLIRYDGADSEPTVTTIASDVSVDDGMPLGQIARELMDTTARYVEAILRARPGPAVICLSGGLDSTSIAAMVRDHRDDALAVIFDIARPQSDQRSDDFHAATAAARYLGLEVAAAVHTPEQLFELLDGVLVAGIDWRDFNVHAGLVNAALARTIADIVGDQRSRTTVFTGDLVNEFLADYHTETYKGETYYRVPRLPMAAARTAFVRGLATSHREIGVFGHVGLTVVQPYAAARGPFLRLPDEVLGPGDGKAKLYRLMFGDALPSTSYNRPKTRAQTGSEHGDRGVLGACIDAGYDAGWLANRFAELHDVPDPRRLNGFLRAGRYRTAIPRGDHDTAQ